MIHRQPSRDNTTSRATLGFPPDPLLRCCPRGLLLAAVELPRLAERACDLVVVEQVILDPANASKLDAALRDMGYASVINERRGNELPQQ